MHHETLRESAAAEVVRDRTGGICGGTMVLTLRGEMPVDILRPGDRIITRSGAMTLKTVSRQRVIAPCVRVAAGSLGHNRPEEDMILPEGAMVHIRDWRAQALRGTPAADIAAADLVDGEFVTRDPDAEVEIYHLAFDEDEVIYAGGLEVRCAA